MNDRWTVCLTLPVLILEGHSMTRPLTRSGGFGMGKQFMTGHAVHITMHKSHPLTYT